MGQGRLRRQEPAGACEQSEPGSTSGSAGLRGEGARGAQGTASSPDPLENHQAPQLSGCSAELGQGPFCAPAGRVAQPQQFPSPQHPPGWQDVTSPLTKAAVAGRAQRAGLERTAERSHHGRAQHAPKPPQLSAPAALPRSEAASPSAAPAGLSASSSSRWALPRAAITHWSGRKPSSCRFGVFNLPLLDFCWVSELSSSRRGPASAVPGSEPEGSTWGGRSNNPPSARGWSSCLTSRETAPPEESQGL